MNTLTGKSTGIALLMAAALLAALFAMGVFAPAGVEAIKSVPKPTAELSNTRLSTADAPQSTTLTVTFELVRAVNSSSSALRLNLPTTTGTNEVVTAASISASNVTVQQNSRDVGGTVTVDATAGAINIAPPSDPTKVPQANTLTVVKIASLATAGTAAEGMVTISQGTVADDGASIAATDTADSNMIGVFNPDAVLTDASAEIGDESDTLVVEFTTQTETGNVTITTPDNYFLVAGATGNISVDVAGPTPAVAANVITLDSIAASTTYKVTITNLSRLSAGDEITLGQTGSGYNVTVTVGGVAVSPATTATGVTAGVISATKADAPVRVTVTGEATAEIPGGRGITVTLPRILHSRQH